MEKILRICMIFFYCDCTKIYHYANLIMPSNIGSNELESAFKKVHESFCDELFYCRDDNDISDGEFLFKKVCEGNNWKYSDFIEECIIETQNSSLQCSSDTLAKQLGIEPAPYVFSIYDDF